MMKILIRGISSMKGGTETFILNYARGLKALGHKIDFLVWCETPYMDRYQDLEANLYYITAKHENIYKHIKELRDFFEKHNDYDVIWDNMNLMSNIDYVKMAHKHGIRKRIVHGHSIDSDAGRLKKFLHRKNRKTVRRYATDLWCCSKDAGEFFFGTPENGIEYTVIRNAIHVKDFIFNEALRGRLREKYGISDKFVIGNLGRLAPEKYPAYILRVYEACRRFMPDSVLVLVGGGVLEDKMKNLVKEREIPDVYFLGYQDVPADFYNMFDIFVMPSLFEGFGMTAIEAQANGLPCLMSDLMPKDAFVTELATSLPIGDKDIPKWAGMIQEKRKRYNGIDRKGWAQKIKYAGFDLEEETPKVERLMAGK